MATGYDAVLQGLSSKDAAGIVLACDISAKTEKEVRFAANKHNTKVVRADFTMNDAEKALGKRTGIFLILNAGLFASIEKASVDLEI